MRGLRVALAAAIVAGAIGAGAGLAADSGPACPTWTDPAGDAGPGTGAVPVGDKDLDVVSAEIASSPSTFLARVRVAKLGAAGPNSSSGTSDQFTVRITVDGVEGELTAKRDATTGAKQSYASVGPTLVEATATYDLDSSTVTVAATAANMAIAAGKPVSGAAVVAVKALTAAGTQEYGLVAYDEAAAPVGTTLKGYCTTTAPAPAPSGSTAPAPTAAPASGGPSPSPSSGSSASTATATIMISAPTRVAYSDPLRMLVSLQDSKGAALGGRRITADFAAARAAGRTAADGRLRLALPALRAAGVYPATARWSGDASAGPASRSVRVQIIRERVAVRITPRTVDGRRVAVITVRDDDGALVRGGGLITVYIDGTRRGTVRLDSAGRATWPARAGSAVTAQYPGASGTYLPARGSNRV